MIHKKFNRLNFQKNSMYLASNPSQPEGRRERSRVIDASTLPATGASAASLPRSGAGARMLRMPVATLRVWERRYRLTQPALDMPQLQHVASTHAQALATTQHNERSDVAHAPPVRAWRLAVVGSALGKRLQRPPVLGRRDGPVGLLGRCGI